MIMWAVCCVRVGPEHKYSPTLKCKNLYKYTSTLKCKNFEFEQLARICMVAFDRATGEYLFNTGAICVTPVSVFVSCRAGAKALPHVPAFVVLCTCTCLHKSTQTSMHQPWTALQR